MWTSHKSSLPGCVLLFAILTTSSLLVAQDSQDADRREELMRWFGSLEFPDVKGLRFVRVSSETSSLDGAKESRHFFGFVTEESEETLTVLGLNFYEAEYEKGAQLTFWLRPVEMRTTELGKYVESYLMFADRRSRNEMSEYEITDFGSISPCTEAVVLSWACDRRGLEGLATKLFARAEVEASKPESLYFAPYVPAFDSLERLIEREKKKYTKDLTLRQIVERDLSRMRAGEVLEDLGDESLTRPQLLARLENFQRRFRNTEQAELVPRTIALLEQMIEEDERHAMLRQDGLPFDQLGRDEQIAELIFQLRDQHGRSIDSPGSFVFFEDDNSPARRLARYGFDAVPQLIAALDDTRLTRAAGYGEEYMFTDRVLRVGDCAEQILARIAGRRSFADRTSQGAELMREDNARRTRKAVLEWFAAAKEKGELRVLSDNVAKGGFFCEGQAEILALKHGAWALRSLVAGIQARAASQTREDMQWRLLRFVHHIPGAHATAYLLDQAHDDPSLVNRFVAAWGLHQRGHPEGVEAMLTLFVDDLDATSDRDGPYFNKSFLTSEIIWFLLRCGKVSAIDAVTKKIEHYEAIVIEQAIVDVVFQRNTLFGGPDCHPETAPVAARDDPKAVRQAQVKFLSGLLEDKEPVDRPYRFGCAKDWDRWRSHARICDFAAAALERLAPDRFQFDLGASEPERDQQIARLKLLR